MLYKSGYCNEESTVRNILAPGPLREACGFYYQEYSSINGLNLKPNDAGLNGRIDSWMEFIIPETAKALAYADHPFFGKWPCITENAFGKGHLIYCATVPSRDIMQKLIARAAERTKLDIPAIKYSFPTIIRSGVNQNGKKIHYIFNYSAAANSVDMPFKGIDLLTGKSYSVNDKINLAAWGVAIIKE